jgi:2-octaprenyl-6-methoxyphenol hydroxylase
MLDYDIAVVGGGLAGSVASLALARGGRKVALVAPEPQGAHDCTDGPFDPLHGAPRALGIHRF